MIRTTLFVTVLSVLMLSAGCSKNDNIVAENDRVNADEDAIEAAVTKLLNDPESARFGKINTTIGAKGNYACVTINAKNPFGGYTGDQQMMVKHYDTSGWVGMTISQTDHRTCMNNARELAGNIPLW